MSNFTVAMILAATLYLIGGLAAEYAISSRFGAYAIGWFIGVLTMVVARRLFKDLDERL
jgi:hypothetical protein